MTAVSRVLLLLGSQPLEVLGGEVISQAAIATKHTKPSKITNTVMSILCAEFQVEEPSIRLYYPVRTIEQIDSKFQK